MSARIFINICRKLELAKLFLMIKSGPMYVKFSILIYHFLFTRTNEVLIKSSNVSCINQLRDCFKKVQSCWNHDKDKCLSQLIFLSVSIPELALPDIPAHVELHVLQAAQCVCQEHRGRHCSCSELQIRFSSGEHHERVPPQS